jgi:hypothetical protein
VDGVGRFNGSPWFNTTIGLAVEQDADAASAGLNTWIAISHCLEAGNTKRTQQLSIAATYMYVKRNVSK